MSVKIARSLLKLPLEGNDLFYCVEENPIGYSNGKAVIFLHGLGENRSGLNYLFQELSSGLTNQGYTVYRFDLAGCGESYLNHSIKTWKKQLQSVEVVTKKHFCTHIISRGISKVLLTDNECSVHIAIGAISEDFFNLHLPLVPIADHSTWWIPIQEKNLTRSREFFWYGLGVEAGCLGGFYLPKAFVEEIKSYFPLVSSKIRSIMPVNTDKVFIDSPSCALSDCHPLFFHANDRKKLLHEIIKIIK